MRCLFGIIQDDNDDDADDDNDDDDYKEEEDNSCSGLHVRMIWIRFLERARGLNGVLYSLWPLVTFKTSGA